MKYFSLEDVRETVTVCHIIKSLCPFVVAAAFCTEWRWHSCIKWSVTSTCLREHATSSAQTVAGSK